jgi:hypothetical protein
MPTAKRKMTSDAIEILHRRYYDGHPERLAELEEARASAAVARAAYELRTKARLSQRQLARRARQRERPALRLPGRVFTLRTAPTVETFDSRTALILCLLRQGVEPNENGHRSILLAVEDDLRSRHRVQTSPVSLPPRPDVGQLTFDRSTPSVRDGARRNRGIRL